MSIEDKPMGVFPATFDPPHIGHMGIVSTALQSGLVRGMELVVTYEHPEKPVVASFDDRLIMTTLAVAEFFGADERVRVNAIEEELPIPSFTHVTLENLIDRFGEIMLFVGSDNVPGIFKWKGIKPILKKSGLAVYPRAGHNTAYPNYFSYMNGKTRVLDGSYPKTVSSGKARAMRDYMGLVGVSGELVARYSRARKLYGIS